jgi:hypothetical protein
MPEFKLAKSKTIDNISTRELPERATTQARREMFRKDEGFSDCRSWLVNCV